MDSPWPIHTLVFDLDDTLFAESEFVRGGFRAAGAWLHQNKGLAGFADEAERLFTEGHRGRIFDEALARLGETADAVLVQQLVAIYREHAPRLTLFPDAREILDWAAGRFHMALISDGYVGTQERKLTALGIEHRFAVAILTDGIGREFWKPNPEAFRQVMLRLPGPAEGFVYIADNPRKDFIGARGIGWKTVRIRRQNGEHENYEPTALEAAHAEIKDLREVTLLIRASV